MTTRPHLRVAFRADPETRERERQAHMHLAATVRAAPKPAADDWAIGHRAGYVDGWHWGCWCGAIAGIVGTGALMGLAVTIGRDWPLVAAFLGVL